MKTIIEFYQSNKEICNLCIYALISVISTVVLCLVKKKPVVNAMDNILKIVLANLPNIIKQVEALYPVGHGDEKKQLVIAAVCKFVYTQFSINLPESMLSYIGARIEDILATPQKKE